MPVEQGDGGGRFTGLPTGGRPSRRARFIIRGYAIALLFSAMALICTSLLKGLFPYPFLFLFFAAVMASAWFGGTGPGIFAVLLSTIAVDYFFVPPLPFVRDQRDGRNVLRVLRCMRFGGQLDQRREKRG